jgi:hypothetical protein
MSNKRSVDFCGHLVYLTTQFGKPFSIKTFGNHFKKWCREANIDPELSLHSVRKRSAERVAENGGAPKHN